MKNNYRFNRIEKKGRHIYLKDFAGRRVFGEEMYHGHIKCKLVHNAKYSLVLPDQIYLDIGGIIIWIQPLFFGGNIISLFESSGVCALYIDISHGAQIKVQFSNDDVISRLEDCSILYKCSIEGPKYLHRYATGEARIDGGIPLLKLYHHTNKVAKASILKSKEYRSSSWNIQGTKRTTNIGYVYLTPLPKVSHKDDLEEIAMSSVGKLAFRLDGNELNVPDLIIDVYRESTINRTETLAHWVDAALLATQPVYRHSPIPGGVYHQVVCPFIHRIGVKPGTNLRIDGDQLVPDNPKRLDYAVVGDATRLTGLSAPYDEEETDEVFKVECMGNNTEIIGFWKASGNTDLHSQKVVEITAFEVADT